MPNISLRLLVLGTILWLVLWVAGCTNNLVESPTKVPSPTPGEAAATVVPMLVMTTPPTHTAVPASTSTPIPSIAAALPDGPPVLLLYNGDGLARTDVDGTVVEPLVSPVSGLGDNVWMYFWNNPPLVSPDGRWLITHSSVSDSRANWQLADLETGAITANGHGQSRLSPAWAPDSQRFSYLTDGQICIYTLITAADMCTPIAENLTGASWSPDEEYIAISQANFEAECCTGNVWAYQVATGMAKIVDDFAAPPQAAINEIFEWAPGTSPILLIKTDPESNSSTLFFAAEGTTTLLNGQVRDISPDGRHVIYSTGEGGSLDGSINYTLPANELCPNIIFDLHNWDWSPDNTRLAFLHFCAAAPKIAWVTVLDVETGEPLWEQEITGIETTFAPAFIFWTPDSQYLLFDEPEELYEGHRQLSPIWRLPADGSGTATAVVEHGFLLGVVSSWNQ